MKSRAIVHPLERRRLLAADPVTLSARGTLGVTGTGGGDVITVVVNGNGIVVVTIEDVVTATFPSADVRRLYVDAAGGGDAVTVNVGRRGTLLGSGGNDTLTGGSGDELLDGGAGDDVLNGEAGSDTLLGGDGNDVVEYGDRGRGFAYAFPDYSILDAGGDPAGVGSARSSDEADLMLDLPETLATTEGVDTFRTSAFPAESDAPPGAAALVIEARGGEDEYRADEDAAFPTTFFGGGGNDDIRYWPGGQATVFGGDGDDRLVLDDEFSTDFDGGAGTDTIDAFLHYDHLDLRDYTSVEVGIAAVGTITGTDGPDRLIATNAVTAVHAGGGNDTITCEDVYNGFFLDGGTGDDSIIGGEGDDYLDGGDGNDLIEGGVGRDTIFGGTGADALAGNGSADKIRGGEGDDTLVGGTGRDRMYGDAGDDQLLARDRRRDTLYGGDGNDEATVDDSVIATDLWGEIESLL